jgi:hypothetical protein
MQQPNIQRWCHARDMAKHKQMLSVSSDGEVQFVHDDWRCEPLSMTIHPDAAKKMIQVLQIYVNKNERS